MPMYQHIYLVTFWVTIINLDSCIGKLQGLRNACLSHRKIMSIILSSLLQKFPPGFSMFSLYPEIHLLGCEVCLRSRSQGYAFSIYCNQKLTPSQLTSIFGLLWNLN
uniref:Uncharacterized protein n=1 Tax=Piliocolobus tephrosceles TaxID=591936 RepID=A0A8C9J3H3_9PRIM